MELCQCGLVLTELQVGDSPSNEVRWEVMVGLDLERWACWSGKGLLGLRLVGVVGLHLIGGKLASWIGLKNDREVGASITCFIVLQGVGVNGHFMAGIHSGVKPRMCGIGGSMVVAVTGEGKCEGKG